MIKNPESDTEEASRIPDWRAKLPKNTIIGWKTYEGPEVPTSPEDREVLITKLLEELWDLKNAIQALPRHPHYTLEQFEEGFDAERENHWLPLLRGLHSVVRHWRHLYPGIDITRRPNYADVTTLMNGLAVPGRFSAQSFRIEFFNIASHFRTYNMCYFRLIDHEVIQEKLTVMLGCLTKASDHYSQDWQDAFNRQNQPITPLSPP